MHDDPVKVNEASLPQKLVKFSLHGRVPHGQNLEMGWLISGVVKDMRIRMTAHLRHEQCDGGFKRGLFLNRIMPPDGLERCSGLAFEATENTEKVFESFAGK